MLFTMMVTATLMINVSSTSPFVTSPPTPLRHGEGSQNPWEREVGRKRFIELTLMIMVMMTMTVGAVLQILLHQLVADFLQGFIHSL
ncbi:hypothetical protein NSTC731_04593 [Nostoc sp. DSM 114167]